MPHSTEEGGSALAEPLKQRRRMELVEADKEAEAQTPDQGELRYEYIEKRSERSAYIVERPKLALGLTQAEVLQLQYPGREGLMLTYKEKDLRYDMDHSYLRKRGAASKGASGGGMGGLGCRKPVMATSPQQGGTGPRRGVRRRHRAEGQSQHRSQGGAQTGRRQGYTAH